ncbi:MAG: hypothetical protein VX910_00360 [Candidatus Latescibacterota bacterium]|nr:hypothetical protein [Candidatus Latescibacterota bacterium]
MVAVDEVMLNWSEGSTDELNLILDGIQGQIRLENVSAANLLLGGRGPRIGGFGYITHDFTITWADRHAWHYRCNAYGGDTHDLGRSLILDIRQNVQTGWKTDQSYCQWLLLNRDFEALDPYWPRVKYKPFNVWVKQPDIGGGKNGTT